MTEKTYDEKIFVQLASYRDNQLVPTIRDALSKASQPENLIFGICWQRDENESLEEFEFHPNVRYMAYDYNESKGLGWARKKVSCLHEDEELTLQLDSHHRFAQDWDKMMMEDYYQAKTMSEKPILSTYLTPFGVAEADEKGVEGLNPTPCLMSQYEFSPDDLLMSMPFFIQDYKERDTVIRARTLSGHFFLVDSSFITEVPYDPEIYFGGYCEETTMSIRAWTRGYDFFSPYRQYIWHEYTREGRPKHWEDHGTVSKTNVNSTERDIFSRKKTRQIFRQEDNGIEILPEYDLGTVRSLREYEEFAGIDFNKKRLQEYTKKVKEPPNPLPWEEQFVKFQYDVDLTWDLEHFKNANFDNPDFITIGIFNNSNKEIYRKDLTISDYEKLVKLEDNNISLTFESSEPPKSVLMYYHDKEKGWSEPYNKEITSSAKRELN